MLVRSSARKSLSSPRIHSLKTVYAPTRCSYLRPDGAASSHRSLVTRPDLLPWRRRRSGFPGFGALHERSLATAMSDSRMQDDNPFGLPSMYGPPPTPTSRFAPYEVRPFDPSKPLVVEAELEAPTRIRTSLSGIPGDVDSMLSVFDACLHMNHLDRAALVLKRFEEFPLLPGPDVIKLHDRYLRANIEQYYSDPNIKWAESMQKWYETRIRAKGLPQSPETIACMLKVSLVSTNDTEKLTRRVNRLMGMVPGDAGLRVFDHVEILSDQDLARITELCTTHTYSPDDFVHETKHYATAAGTRDVSSQDSSDSAQAKSNELATEVHSVPQKGLGLKTLRGVLSFFSDVKDRDISQLSPTEQREIQSRLENDCVEAAIDRWREEHQALMKMGRPSAVATNALNSQLYDWQCSLEARLRDDFKKMSRALETETKNSEGMDLSIIAPFLLQSNPTRLAAVSILSVLNSTAQSGGDNGATLAQAVTSLGKSIEEDIKLQRKMAASKKAKHARRKARNLEDTKATNSHSNPKIDEVSNKIKPPTFASEGWPVAIRAKVAAAVLLALVESAKITVVREHPESKALVSQIQSAFAKTFVFKRGKRIGMLMPHKHLMDLMKREPRGDFLARHLPMLVEPEPWTKFDKGGFLEAPSSLIRVKNGDKDQRIYAEAAIKRGDLEQVCKGLDVLGATAWRINRPVFEVMLEAWNRGEAIANFPALDPNIPTPLEPAFDDDPLKRREWIRAVKVAENERSGLHSERCFINFQMEIANAFKEQTFYLPHNMDFRGRAYPIPTYLNHMGADNARGLLRFAKGKKLGERGLLWLKVHLANVFGFDKASIQERADFATDNLESIIDSATNPLNGTRWWLKAEDPWQCLGACFELKAAMELEDPTQYISHLPVHQDGTCNGLQHYAALGGDRWGAKQVNLEPGDRPADVYTAVADLVKESIAEDIEQGNMLAKAMSGKITRKVVKQTVMTNVYGVTFMGAKAQVHKQIEAAYPNIRGETGYPPMLLASYVATKIFKALSTMFRGAHDIQYWLGECAGRVCRAVTPEQLDRLTKITADPSAPKKKSTRAAKSVALNSTESTSKESFTKAELLGQFRSSIVWTTPLRLPVVQPYRKNGVRTINTALQDLNLSIPERSDPVNRRKQLQAFPPNFIHSLDATHMLLSAIECNELGLDFAAVHDSFWTHAGDIDDMNRVIRDSFIRIHSEGVIERLASEFEARYKGSLYFAKVESGTPADKKITSHRNKHKFTAQQELCQEVERLRLLQSSDPAEVQRGREMETPASILEEFTDAKVDLADEDLTDIGLGNVPSPDVVLKAAGAFGQGKGLPKTTKSLTDDPKRLKSYLTESSFEMTLKDTKTKTNDGTRATGVWIPLEFPKIPEKGDFDVKRLKGSQYFFS